MAKTRILNHKADYGKQLTVHYITDDDEAVRACDDLLTEKVIGYDIETTYADGYASDPQAGLDPFRSRIRLVQFGKIDGTIYVLDLFALSGKAEAAIRRVLESGTVKTGHNLKFDVKFARHHLKAIRFGKLFCTELTSRLVACGREWKRVSLARAADKYLNVKLSKEEQRSDWSLPKLSDKQLVYAAQDAYIVLPLRERLIVEIQRLAIVNTVKLEMDALDPVCAMELAGFRLLPDRWLEAEVFAHARRIEVSEYIWKALEEIAPQQALIEHTPLFKIGSQQIMSELLTDFGIELPEADEPKSKEKQEKTKKTKKKAATLDDDSLGLLFGDASPVEAATATAPVKTRGRWEGNRLVFDEPEDEPEARKPAAPRKTTRNWKIKPLADRFEIIAYLIEWRELNKRKTSYGEKYLSNINPATGRIHADYDPLRAVTGRYSCAKPNLQQIPRLPIYRRCFVPTDGFVFVGADYSQIELRLLAEFSGDPGFIEAFKSGLDFHDATTLQMFTEELVGAFPDGATMPPAKGTPEYDTWKKTEGFVTWTKYRTYAKNINFGIPYGMGAGTLALRTGMTFEEASEHLENYKTRFPHVIQYLNKCAAMVRRTHEIRTVSGRIAHFDFNADDKRSVAGAERNGKNTPIQGGNADILKRALRLLFDLMVEEGHVQNDTIRIVNIVHDEIITEARIGYEKAACELLEKAMLAAAHEVLKEVPVLVEADVSTEWKK